MTVSEWAQILKDIEGLLLQRKNLLVSQEIDRFMVKKPPRECLSKFAALARRAGFSYQSLRILQPLFRKEGRSINLNTSTHEKTIYGSALIVVGAKDEGLRLLEEIDPKEQPEALSFKATAKISEWKYSEALPILEDYLNNYELSPLQRLVGALNLSSCYIVANKPQKFKRLIKDCYQLAEQTKAQHLRLSIVELEAQFYYSQNEFNRSQQIIRKSFPNGIQEPSTVFEALLKKWDLLSLSQISQGRNEQRNIYEAIGQLGQVCKHKQYWEVYRNCDLQYGLLTDQETKVYKAYFGSPYKEYRKKLLGQIKGRFDIPDWWINKSSDSNSIFALNRTTASCGNDVIIEPFKKSWNLFFLLSQDLYRPVSLGYLFNELFPEEYFAKRLAAHRVQQLLLGLRKAFNSKDLTIDIQAKHTNYRLIDIPSLLYSKNDRSYSSQSNFIIDRIRQQKDRGYVTAKSIETEFNISRSLTLSILSKLETQKVLEKKKRGRNTVYQFINSGRVNL